MVRILGMSGSLRAGSCDTALLHAAREFAGEGAVPEIATLHGIALSGSDAEPADDIPAAVEALNATFAAGALVSAARV